MDFEVFGIAGALAVKRVVDALKRYGLPTKWAMTAAFAIAAVLLAANEVATMSPGFLAWYERVWNVLFFALAAAEVYDLQHTLARRAEEPLPHSIAGS